MFTCLTRPGMLTLSTRLEGSDSPFASAGNPLPNLSVNWSTDKADVLPFSSPSGKGRVTAQAGQSWLTTGEITVRNLTPKQIWSNLLVHSRIETRAGSRPDDACQKTHQGLPAR